MDKLVAPVSGTVVALPAIGSAFARGAELAVLESMKMEHVVRAQKSGVVQEHLVTIGEVVEQGAALLVLNSNEYDSAQLASNQKPHTQTTAVVHGAAPSVTSPVTATGTLRTDLEALQSRQALTADAARAQAIQKRHALGFQSARENIAQLCDAGSFIEYGALAFAAQTQRRARQELIEQTPADGIVTGLGQVNGQRVALFAYDMTVLAGTQGMRSHQKTDRLLQVALQEKLPVVLFAEGGGGRPGDTDMPIVAGLHVTTFARFAALSGQVPLLGIVNGRCFAGNAALVGCCDIIIATQNSNLGLGGPAMIEGGGLGLVSADEIGPSDVQYRNGVIDVLVGNEAQAIVVAKKILAIARVQSLALQSPELQSASNQETSNQEILRQAVPENRLRVYEVAPIISTVFDKDSVIELRSGFGCAMRVGLAMLKGKSIAFMANDCAHKGGAIDAEAAIKLNGLLQLAQRYNLPIVSFVDTPGFMVGPASEAQGHVRHAGQLFVSAAKLTKPLVAVVLRKGYGLGAMAMAAGGFHNTLATLAWPTAEFGAMGLEGAVKLGFKKELLAQTDPTAREALYQKLLANQYNEGSAIRMAETLEIDAVIDPKDTRAQLIGLLATTE